VTGARLWLTESGPAEPTGYVCAFLETSGPSSPFTDAVTVSFGDGMWFLLGRDGEISSTTWATLLSVADAVVQYDPAVRCRYAFAPPADYHWALQPEGEPPYRCAWPGHAPIGAHLIRGLAWLSESEHSVELPDA
jgi:hypothetical protein